DLIRLNASNLIKDNDGLLWINITRQKVEGAECVIPVIGKVWKILAKYNFSLPSFSNQKYNAALKKIASEVGIRKKLTTHVGRKTYGTILLNKDVPIETVSNLLGHSNIRTTQKHYAKVLHMKIARDIRFII
ncbi:MAG: integrase catalytic domain-containing protein, partial [Bacteroidales bacterium]|nr:integrase catalytic domain-containing protein [Bacteroidales bacterium]